MVLGALEPVLTPERAVAGNTAVTDMLAYLEVLVADRRAHLRDPNVDVLTRLILGENETERLTENQLLHQCIFLLNAGHETTTNLIGNALYALTEWPAERAKLIAGLSDSAAIGKAVEEFLRFESPVQLGNRITTHAIVIGGIELPPESRITHPRRIRTEHTLESELLGTRRREASSPRPSGVSSTSASSTERAVCTPGE